MYGMVNEGVRQFIETNFDAATWDAVCKKASVDNVHFERMSSYDDAITYNLVGAICEHTGISPEMALEKFGAYWVEFVGASSFGNLLKLAGRTFIEKLEGLDELHERVFVSMPNLKPPSFEVEETGENTYHLHYFSEREGLAPMVIGLLHGLAQETGEKIEVEQVAAKAAGADHDIFKVVLLT